MGAIDYLPHYSYDDYTQWEGDWELIDGTAYAMAPAPSVMHQNISLNIAVEFRQKLKECQHCKALMEVDYKIDDHTTLRPDVLVACNISIDANFIDSVPEIIFEVLSPSTKLKDRTLKFQVYQNQGVKYYILVDPKSKMAEIYTLSSKGLYVLSTEVNDENILFEFDACTVDYSFKEIWQ